MTKATFRDVTAPVFRETTAEQRTQSVPLSHVSIELGHLYVEDFEDGPERLREHFTRVRPWADAARALAGGNGKRPRISTCFLVDDYFTRFSSPADLLPDLLVEADNAGLAIDYLARESGCAEAEGTPLAASVADRLVESPPPGSDGSRPPVAEIGWLANGQRTPGTEALEAMAGIREWRPPSETTPSRHSIFLDVELWDDRDGVRTWSCSLLAAVWQLARLGLLRHEGKPVLEPRPWSGESYPRDWNDLPALIQLNPEAAPFSAYLTCSVLPSRFLSIEHAVRVILDQVDVDHEALGQVSERSAREGVRVPEGIADRVSYVLYAGP